MDTSQITETEKAAETSEAPSPSVILTSHNTRVPSTMRIFDSLKYGDETKRETMREKSKLT